MVGTASHESIQTGTKLLDIPLNPENNMTALWVGERQETASGFICACFSALNSSFKFILKLRCGLIIKIPYTGQRVHSVTINKKGTKQTSSHIVICRGRAEPFFHKDEVKKREKITTDLLHFYTNLPIGLIQESQD